MKSFKKCGISGPRIATHATDTAPFRVRSQSQNFLFCIGGLMEVGRVTDIDGVCDVRDTKTASR